MSKATHGFRKNQKLTLKIESIAAGGQGFAKQDGLAIFVDRGVPGDVAEIEIYDLRKDFAHARVLRVIEGSPMRAEAPCKLFNVCGGCQWQHIIYDKQLELKTDIVKQALKHIGGLDPELVLAAIASELPLNYRNKVQFPVGSPHKSDRILAGYYKQGSHELINIKHCPVQPELVDEILEVAKTAAENAGYSAYQESTHTGLIRHMIARYSFSEQEVLFTVVLNMKAEIRADFQSSLERFADELMQAVPQVVGFCVNFNDQRGNRIMGNTTKLVRGRDFIIEKLASQHPKASEKLRQGLKFQLSPVSFFQVNSVQAVRLMDLVLDAVVQYGEANSLKKVPLIVDAFAGVASIALWVSDLADRVVAIEEVQDAITDAAKIIKMNSVENVEPLHGKVEDLFPKMVSEGTEAPIVILDPPRKGVDASALKSVAGLNPERIIYVSCNPATLARDLKTLKELGYECKSIQPVDLFPQTFHVESVSVLDRIKN